jgi:3-phenylpropionate/trans-cinnamate dioxygenase ferredoxin reductase subunit
VGRIPDRIVIVGAGQAAAQAVLALRKRGFEGKLTVIGDEPHVPYQRPPLSKAYLKGDCAQARLWVRPRSFYDQRNVEMRLGERVVAIDRETRRIRIEGGATLPYDAAIIATGARARLLDIPGGDLRGIASLRSLADADNFRRAVGTAERLVVVGGGYIGLEVAAAAARMGKAVTVLESKPHLLARVTSPLVGEFMRRTHEHEGVVIRCRAGVERFVGDGGHVQGAVLTGGETIAADLVLVGVGAVPNAELAAEAGLDVDDGILVDETARTSDCAIYAAGDCTRRTLDGYPGTWRLESVHNAVEQAECAAARILAQNAPPYDPPWFWSDQYDVKLQTVGLSTGFDQAVLRGDVGHGRFAVFYYRAHALVAVDALSEPASFLAAKKVLKAGKTITPAEAADLALDLKDLANSRTP